MTAPPYLALSQIITPVAFTQHADRPDRWARAGRGSVWHAHAEDHREGFSRLSLSPRCRSVREFCSCLVICDLTIFVIQSSFLFSIRTTLLSSVRLLHCEASSKLRQPFTQKAALKLSRHSPTVLCRGTRRAAEAKRSSSFDDGQGRGGSDRQAQRRGSVSSEPVCAPVTLAYKVHRCCLPRFAVGRSGHHTGGRANERASHTKQPSQTDSPRRRAPHTFSLDWSSSTDSTTKVLRAISQSPADNSALPKSTSGLLLSAYCQASGSTIDSKQ